MIYINVVYFYYNEHSIKFLGAYTSVLEDNIIKIYNKDFAFAFGHCERYLI